MCRPFYFKQDLDINNAQSNWTLNSYVVSASINDSKIMNLEDRVVVTFSHQIPKKVTNKCFSVCE